MGETVITGSELLPNVSSSNTSEAHISKREEECHNVPKTAAHLPPTAFKKGHRRGDSKTDFILPPGHEERERKRALQRYYYNLHCLGIGLNQKYFTRICEF